MTIRGRQPSQCTFRNRFPESFFCSSGHTTHTEPSLVPLESWSIPSIESFTFSVLQQTHLLSIVSVIDPLLSSACPSTCRLSNTSIPLTPRTMAIQITAMNPQEAEDASLLQLLESNSFGSTNSSVSSSRNNSPRHHHRYKSYSPTHLGGRRKPNRMLLYVRNRTGSWTPRTTGNFSALAVGLVLSALIFHRTCSIYMTHRRWINAPITYMHRTCPAPQYPLLFPNAQEQYRSLLDTNAAAVETAELPNPADARWHSGLKICLTSLTDQKLPSRLQRFMRWRNFDGIMDLTRPNKETYCQKHGYHCFDGSDHHDASRPPAWSKIRAVQALLDGPEQCDWVLWMDADTVIMNSDVRIEDFLPADATQDLLVASDKGGGYNSGVFFFRNSAWSRQFLDEWWNMKDFVRPPGLSLSGDNAAMKALLKSMEDQGTFDAHVLSPPRCTFNSFAQFLTLGQSIEIMDHLTEQDWYFDSEHYHKGDFIAHIPGVDNKAECLKLLLREAR
jgi:galactosyl transferase GMA12/MNN10 family